MRMSRDRLAIAAAFGIHGAVGGGLAARMPAVAGNLHLSPGMLGVALLMPAVGGVATMPFTGWVIHRLGVRSATRALLTLWAASLVLPAVATGLWGLAAGFLVYGAAAASADVAINAQAVAIEARVGRPILSGLHGLWSVGSFIGSGIGALAALAGIGYRPHLVVVAAVLAALAVLAGNALPGDRRSDARADVPPPRRFSLPTGTILLLGLVAFCAGFAEASGINWSAIYLNRVAGASQAVAATAYSGFAGVMAAMRLCGDRVIRALGPVLTVRASGLIGVAGGVLIVTGRGTVTAFCGFALLGIGIATAIPLAFATAGRIGPHPGQAIAGVATVSYAANLIGPAAIGGIADAVSLPAAFTIVAALPAFIALGGGLMRPKAPATPGVTATAPNQPAPSQPVPPT
ncbi:MFS transporter [Rugosimonospora africana]|uniref:MFS transporter n=1 Tax=Rugosimonospora africana TaxID=556532 RepID=A0A8J3VPR8_9ACTN|nr:MFS transporter [Rugosimonospora africana]GIH14380.1 MFS transporter [Rugosimonospora africana]